MSNDKRYKRLSFCNILIPVKPASYLFIVFNVSSVGQEKITGDKNTNSLEKITSNTSHYEN